MAFKFTLVKPADGSTAIGYYGFAWSTLLGGPLIPLARRDFGSSFLLMLGEVLICGFVFAFDRNPMLLIARLGLVTFSWALLYNELHTLGLIASGFRFDGSPDAVSALERRFPVAGQGDRVRLLRERSLVFVVFSLGCLQAVVHGVPNSSPTIDARKSPSVTTSASPVPSPVPETPKVMPTSVPPVVPSPSPTAVPRPTETPSPPAKSAAVVLAEQQRECDAAMGTQFDSDLPPNGGKYIADTSILSEADINRAIASCEVARTGPGRRFNTQLGRGYAARAVLLASRGNEADARDTMNKAITYWNAAEAQGSGAAMNFLGALYKGTFNSSTFSFLQPDYPKALQYWLNGDRAGNLKAARNAGGLLLLGPADFPGVPQDIKKSRELLEKAIRGNDMTAASLYGQALFYGYPAEIKKDAATGLDLLIKACSSGDQSAKVFFDNEFAKTRRSPLLPASRPTGC